MQRCREISLVPAVCLILLVLLTFPAHPPTVSTTEENPLYSGSDHRSESGNDPAITIQVPAFVSLHTTFPVHVSMNNSEPMRIKVSLLSPERKHAAQFWNGTNWVYPGGSWSSMPVVEPVFEGFFHLKPRESYSGWGPLHDSPVGFINVTARYLDSSTNIKRGVSIDIIDHPPTNGTLGFNLCGTVFFNEKPLLEGFLRVMNAPISIASNKNTTPAAQRLDPMVFKENSTPISQRLNQSITFGFTSDPAIGGDIGSEGSFHLWVPEGTYLLEVYSNVSSRDPLFTQEISMHSDLELNFGDPPPIIFPVEGHRHLMITEIYYTTYGGGSGEYVILYNQKNTTVNLTGWTLSDGEHVCELRDITLDSGQSLTLARDPDRYYHLTGEHADTSYFLSLSDSKDSLTLFDPTGRIVDSLGWGGEAVEGCNGSIEAYSQGRVLRRNMAAGTYVDTNMKSDWESNRIFMVGQTEYPIQEFTISGSITPFVSPDCSFDVILGELRKASLSIDLNMYEFTNVHLAEAFLEAIERGVKVTLFLEGSPVGGISELELHLLTMLSDAGASVKFIHNNDTIKDRYNYNHAKYCVIDDRTLIIDSENWKSSGIPVDPTYGNRGWGVVIRNGSFARYFGALLAHDSNDVFADIVEFGDPPYVPPEDLFLDNSVSSENDSLHTSVSAGNYSLHTSVLSSTYDPMFQATTLHGNFRIIPVIAPDHTLSNETILGVMQRARESVFIQQLQCALSWGDGLPNLYLDEAIRAAERGCDVKILLDSRYVDIRDDKLDNYDTVNLINEIARERMLPNLEARLMVLKGIDKLHNKGIIVDNEFTLISSINWGRGAVLLNREAGVIIESRQLAEYFTEIFHLDWNMKERKEMVQGWDLGGTPPEQYVLGALSILCGTATAWLTQRKE